MDGGVRGWELVVHGVVELRRREAHALSLRRTAQPGER